MMSADQVDERSKKASLPEGAGEGDNSERGAKRNIKKERLRLQPCLSPLLSLLGGTQSVLLSQGSCVT